jgi:predicted 2-oxoglutarate/Fe(II)-dependent dioxygenase YbiX
MQRNVVCHDPAHPWRQQQSTDLCNRLRLEWSEYDSTLYFPAGRKYFSGDLDFLLQNYSEAAQRKWLASVAAAREKKVHNTVNVTRGERAVMFTWLHGE